MNNISETGYKIMKELFTVDNYLQDFYETGGVYPAIIEKLIDLKYHPDRPQCHDTFRLEVSEVLVAATSYCNEVTKAKSATTRSREIISIFSTQYKTREIQLVMGVAYLLLLTHYIDNKVSERIAQELEKSYCTDRYSRFYTGRAIYRKIQKGEIVPEKLKSREVDHKTNNSKVDREMVMTAEEQMEFLSNNACHTFCPGDIAYATNSDGNKMNIVVTKVRPSGYDFVPAEHKPKTHTTDFAIVLDRLCKFMEEAYKQVTTVPSLCAIYGVAIMEVDYALTRAYLDSRLLNQGLFLTFGESGWRIKYKGRAMRLELALSKWAYNEFLEIDDVCYFNPGFEFEPFVENHKALWERLHDKTNALIKLLKDMQLAIDRPSSDKLVNMYNMLENNYKRGVYARDLDEFETFLFGLPKINKQRRLEEKLLDYEAELRNSSFLSFMGDDVYTALHSIMLEETGEWDKESIGRYIFANRKVMNPEMVNSFFKYVFMTNRVREEIEKLPQAQIVTEETIKKDDVSVNLSATTEGATVTVPATHLQDQMMSFLTRISELQNSGLPLNFSVNFIQGDNVGFKSKDNYGENIFMGPNGRIVRDNTDEHEEPRQ